MKFKYQALDQKGTLKEGEIEALNLESAQEALRERGLWPLELKSASRFRLRLKKTSALPELILFTVQLSRLLKAGLPLDRALRILARLFESAGKENLTVLIESLQKDLEAGEDFATTLSRHEFFPPYYVSLVRAGQTAGALPEILESLADYLQKQQAFRQELLSALLYPSFLLVFGLFAVQTVLVYVLPRFGRIFDDLGVKPPAFTQFLINLGLFWRDWGPVVLLVLVAGFFFLRLRLSTPEGRQKVENLLLRLPLFGRNLLLADLARVFRGLSVMMRGGVAIERALLLASEIPKLRYLRDLLLRTGEEVKKGRPLSSCFQGLPFNLAFVYDLLAVGEETGDLAQAFADIASLAEEEVQNATKRFLTILEPAAILFFGLLLGTIIISIMLAIFDLRI